MSASPHHSDPNMSEEKDEVEHMHEAFVGALASNGVLGKLRAQLRMAALGIVRDDSRRVNVFKANKPPSKLNEAEKIAALLCNDLLTTSGYNCSQSIFEEEASLGEIGNPGRDSIMDALNLPPSVPTPSNSTPLLVHLISQILAGGLDGGVSQNQSSVAPANVADHSGASKSAEMPSSAPMPQPTTIAGGAADADDWEAEYNITIDGAATTQMGGAPDPEEPSPSTIPSTTNVTSSSTAAASTQQQPVAAEWKDDSIAFSDISDSRSLEEGDEYDIVEDVELPDVATNPPTATNSAPATARPATVPATTTNTATMELPMDDYQPPACVLTRDSDEDDNPYGAEDSFEDSDDSDTF